MAVGFAAALVIAYSAFMGLTLGLAGAAAGYAFHAIVILLCALARKLSNEQFVSLVFDQNSFRRPTLFGAALGVSLGGLIILQELTSAG